MSYLYDALREIEVLLVTVPLTGREARIYSVACAALNLADGEAAEQITEPDRPTWAEIQDDIAKHGNYSYERVLQNRAAG